MVVRPCHLLFLVLVVVDHLRKGRKQIQNKMSMKLVFFLGSLILTKYHCLMHSLKTLFNLGISFQCSAVFLAPIAMGPWGAQPIANRFTNQTMLHQSFSPLASLPSPIPWSSPPSLPGWIGPAERCTWGTLPALVTMCPSCHAWGLMTPK